jgi:uncharacterized protein (TIGR00303 family)
MRCKFFLVLAGTELIKHKGISAAGANQDLLKYTAALDAEYIYHGETKTLKNLPVSPNSIVSPAIITRACINLLREIGWDIEIRIFDLGAFIKPQAPHISIFNKPSRSIEAGTALDYQEVLDIYEAGRKFSQSYLRDEAANDELWLIAECVVGGTTTAQGFLKMFGYNCEGMLSSSVPAGNHHLKASLITEGYKKGINREDYKTHGNHPLFAVSAMGDAMQAFTAGLVQEAATNDLPPRIILAGGTQMMAVSVLIENLMNRNKIQNLYEIVTSQWVMNDKSAQVDELAAMLCPNTKISYAQVNPNNHKVFMDYEQGHVKEGVGAGALLKLCLENAVSEPVLAEELDKLLDLKSGVF